jgi:hypothetical protein
MASRSTTNYGMANRTAPTIGDVAGKGKRAPACIVCGIEVGRWAKRCSLHAFEHTQARNRDRSRALLPRPHDPDWVAKQWEKAGRIMKASGAT